MTSRRFRLGWPPARSRLGVHPTPIPTQYLNPAVLPEPLHDRRHGGLGQQLDRSVLIQVHEHGAVHVTAPEGPVVHAQHARRGCGVLGGHAHQPQEGHPTGAQVQAPDQAGTRSPAESQAYCLQERRQQAGAAGVHRDQRWQPLAEDAARARAR